MALAESVKITRALELMSSLERLKQERRFCNFTVKVDNQSFEVDKNVMVASSPYFEALFSSQMEEVNSGVVDMKEVDANAIKLSIGFIYSGEAKLDMDSIQHVLHAGNLLGIPLLLNLCFGHMEKHLSPQNCIKVMLLTDTYSNESLNKKAYEVLTSKPKDVINSDTLRNLCRSDFKIVTDSIFSDIGKLEEEIGDDVDVCFKLKKSLEILGNDASAKDSALIKFLIKNAANIFQGTKFLDMNNSFVENIIQEGNCSEELKYEALLRWTKHVKKRKKHFSKLFKFIKLETFSLDFLKQKVQSEKYVEESPECLNYLVKALFIVAEKKNSSETSTSLNAGVMTPSSATQRPSTSKSSNSSGRVPGANQIPSSNPLSTNICRKCTRPIHDGEEKCYFRCCNVYVHDDCLMWYEKGRWVLCPQCGVYQWQNDECSYGHDGELLNDDEGASSSGSVNQIPPSNPSSTNICRKCTKPIPDGELKCYFRCCNVYVHDDCLLWCSQWHGQANCPQCRVRRRHNEDGYSFG